MYFEIGRAAVVRSSSRKPQLVCTDGAVRQNPEIVLRMGGHILPPGTCETQSLKVERSEATLKTVPSLDLDHEVVSIAA